MKEIRTIRMVEQTEVVFIAEDGKEFRGDNAEFKCREHERTCNEENVRREFDRLEWEFIRIPFVCEIDDDCEYMHVKLNSKRDFVSLVDYAKVILLKGDIYLKEPAAYPYTMTVLFGYDYASEYGGNLAEEAKAMLNQLESFG